MPIPMYPTELLPRPFADKGVYQVVPDDKAASGRASFKEGFPAETQLPLANGGIAPSRPDFNGMFHMLSTLAFWQQSGGMWTYKPALNYNTPSAVFHNGGLWFCRAANGPDTQVPGVVEPGTNTDYWIDFIEFLSGSGSGGGGFGTPVGTVIMFHGVAAPDGYFVCDGRAFNVAAYPQLAAVLGGGTLPDLRGQFVRGSDPTATVDPDGAARAVGSKQADAMNKNVGSGSFFADLGNGWDTSTTAKMPSGAFSIASGIMGTCVDPNSGRGYGMRIAYNPAYGGTASTEVRPRNVSLLYCIKHD